MEHDGSDPVAVVANRERDERPCGPLGSLTDAGGVLSNASAQTLGKNNHTQANDE